MVGDKQSLMSNAGREINKTLRVYYMNDELELKTLFRYT